MSCRVWFPLGAPLPKNVSSSNILVPSQFQGYQLKDISAALGSALRNKTISVQCFFSSHDKLSAANDANEVFSTKHQYLSQVEVCLDKQFEPIDCPDAGTCSRHQPIYYPPIIHRKMFTSPALARILGGNSLPLIL